MASVLPTGNTLELELLATQAYQETLESHNDEDIARALADPLQASLVRDYFFILPIYVNQFILITPFSDQDCGT